MTIAEEFCEINNALQNAVAAVGHSKELLSDKPIAAFTQEEEAEFKEVLSYAEVSTMRASKAIDALMDTLYSFKNIEVLAKA